MTDARKRIAAALLSCRDPQISRLASSGCNLRFGHGYSSLGPVRRGWFVIRPLGDIYLGASVAEVEERVAALSEGYHRG